MVRSDILHFDRRLRGEGDTENSLFSSPPRCACSSFWLISVGDNVECWEVKKIGWWDVDSSCHSLKKFRIWMEFCFWRAAL